MLEAVEFELRRPKQIPKVAMAAMPTMFVSVPLFAQALMLLELAARILTVWVSVVCITLIHQVQLEQQVVRVGLPMLQRLLPPV